MCLYLYPKRAARWIYNTSNFAGYDRTDVWLFYYNNNPQPRPTLTHFTTWLEYSLVCRGYASLLRWVNIFYTWTPFANDFFSCSFLNAFPKKSLYLPSPKHVHQTSMHTQKHNWTLHITHKGGPIWRSCLCVCVFVSLSYNAHFFCSPPLRPRATFALIHQPDELCPFNIANSIMKKEK